jgi:endonuclease YncB( thermonuclease family)
VQQRTRRARQRAVGDVAQELVAEAVRARPLARELDDDLAPCERAQRRRRIGVQQRAQPVL